MTHMPITGNAGSTRTARTTRIRESVTRRREPSELASAALWLGILSIVSAVITVLGLALAFASLWAAFKARETLTQPHAPQTGLRRANAGIVLGSIGFLLSTASAVVGAAVLTAG